MKVTLILVESGNPAVPNGLVKQYDELMPWKDKLEDENAGTIVGTWGWYDYGTFYIELTTPIEAMQDRFIQLMKEISRKNQQYIASRVRYHEPEKFIPSIEGCVPTKRREAKEIPPAPSIDFSNLRARLGK